MFHMNLLLTCKIRCIRLIFASGMAIRVLQRVVPRRDGRSAAASGHRVVRSLSRRRRFVVARRKRLVDVDASPGRRCTLVMVVVMSGVRLHTSEMGLVRLVSATWTWEMIYSWYFVYIYTNNKLQ